MRIPAMRTLLVAICIVLGGFALMAQQIQPENIPDQIAGAVEGGSFSRTYVVNGSMNPFYLRGDFDGDGRADYALWIKSRNSGEVGIAIWLSTARKFTILGAGTAFSVSGARFSDLKFLNTWQVYGKRPVERGVDAGPPPRLVGEAILAGKAESASGLIYWDGRSFEWYQQGD